jgi:glutamyl-tRNA synthetase
MKDRAETLEGLVDAMMIFYGEARATPEQLAAGLTDEVRPALAQLADRFSSIGDWSEESVMAAVNAVLNERKLKLPKIAMPLRLIVFGRAQTPNLGPTLAVAGKERVLERLREHLAA